MPAPDSMTPTLALVGDYSADVSAHRAIPRALELACDDLQVVGRGLPTSPRFATWPATAGSGDPALQPDVAWRWVRTRDIHDAPRELAGYAGIWVVPASPYENTDGALAAIRFARDTRRPFLGTCGGFQHALIEFARNVAGLARADHAETNAAADTLVITPLACSLVGQTGAVRFVPGTRLRGIYGRDSAHEGYHCNYGVNPEHREAFERAGLRFSAFAEDGAIRGAELPAPVHPFFIGTLFQPERVALRDEVPPIVRAFLTAVLAYRQPPAGPAPIGRQDAGITS